MARSPQAKGMLWNTVDVPPPGSSSVILYCSAAGSMPPVPKKPAASPILIPASPQARDTSAGAVGVRDRSLVSNWNVGPPASWICLMARLMPFRLCWP